MYMKLNKELEQEFAAYTRSINRRETCTKRENVSPFVVHRITWIVMNVCFTSGNLNRTFWICQRSIAKSAKRSERWIYQIIKGLISANYLEKVGQKIYARDVYGPNIFRLGKKFKAMFFAFMKQQGNRFSKYIAKKRDVLYRRKQTSDFNLKERDKVAPVSISPSQYSFIPDFRRLIESL